MFDLLEEAFNLYTDYGPHRLETRRHRQLPFQYPYTNHQTTPKNWRRKLKTAVERKSLVERKQSHVLNFKARVHLELKSIRVRTVLEL